MPVGACDPRPVQVTAGREARGNVGRSLRRLPLKYPSHVRPRAATPELTRPDPREGPIDYPGAVGRAMPAAPDVIRMRAPTTPLTDTLHRVGQRWLDALPPAHRPVTLAQRFPRIVNQLARVWDRPSACLAYLDSLRVDRRGGRQGFPPAIRDEIHALAAWYAQRHAPHPSRVPADPWRDEPLRLRAADPRLAPLPPGLQLRRTGR